MTETGLAYYAYCIVPADGLPELEGLTGVDRPFKVEVVTHGDLSAIVSRVRLQEFGAEALKQNLEDLAWLARTARAHNAVLARSLAADAVVPLRLCTIFADEAGVRDVLDRERQRLRKALSRLRGRTEWSVKMLADPRALKAATRARAPSPAATEAQGSGRDYFARKKLEQVAHEETRAVVARVVEETHARLRKEAAAATRLPPQDRRLSGHTGEMVLNGAYLVERSSAAAFAAIAKELGARHRDIGIAVDVSGPFAPYNFVGAGEPSQ
jgi:hypothetical protein